LKLILSSMNDKLAEAPLGSYAHSWTAQEVNKINKLLKSRNNIFSTDEYDLESTYVNFYQCFHECPFNCTDWKFRKPIFSPEQQAHYELNDNEANLSIVIRDLNLSSNEDVTSFRLQSTSFNNKFDPPSGRSRSSTSLLNSRGRNNRGMLQFEIEPSIDVILSFGSTVLVILILIRLILNNSFNFNFHFSL